MAMARSISSCFPLFELDEFHRRLSGSGFNYFMITFTGKARLAHIRSKKSWNAALFVTVTPAVHTNPSWNGALRNTNSNGRNLTLALRARVSIDGKFLLNGAFQEQCRHENPVISLISEFSSTANPTDDKWLHVAFSNSLKHCGRKTFDALSPGKCTCVEGAWYIINQHVLTCVELTTF